MKAIFYEAMPYLVFFLAGTLVSLALYAIISINYIKTPDERYIVFSDEKQKTPKS